MKPKVPSFPEGMLVYQERFVQRNQHRIYVREYPGAEPMIILMHGFPFALRMLPSWRHYASRQTMTAEKHSMPVQRIGV